MCQVGCRVLGIQQRSGHFPEEKCRREARGQLPEQKPGVRQEGAGGRGGSSTPGRRNRVGGSTGGGAGGNHNMKGSRRAGHPRSGGFTLRARGPSLVFFSEDPLVAVGQVSNRERV